MNIAMGFEPFGRFEKNPAWEVVRELDFDKKFKIPVTYEEAKKWGRKIMEMHPDMAVALGLSYRSREIKIEALGVNIMHSNIPDNSGFAPKNMRIFDDGPGCHLANVPFFDIKEELLREDIPAVVSLSAGTYVCNALLYSLLHYREKISKNTKVLFLHIPPTKDMAEHGWDMEGIKYAVEKTVEITSRLSSL